MSELMALPVESRKRIANATLSSKWKTVEAYRDEAEYEQVFIFSFFFLLFPPFPLTFSSGKRRAKVVD